MLRVTLFGRNRDDAEQCVAEAPPKPQQQFHAKAGETKSVTRATIAIAKAPENQPASRRIVISFNAYSNGMFRSLIRFCFSFGAKK